MNNKKLSKAISNINIMTSRTESINHVVQKLILTGPYIAKWTK